ncbi:MAG: class I SAM-dependent methyltransferase, partial [Burkholderiaceae bacterium]|nr:class I SAM-dependent methyltransferase [Burkholderiaceae bacterium]
MVPRLPWPLPAVLGWSASWLLFLLLPQAGLPPLAGLLAASLLGTLVSLSGDTLWRKLFIAGGFPLSLGLTQAAAFPPWAWLLPLACLLLLYPLRAWGDAPVFPTPPDALN